jgi:hypothetical protein
VVQTGEMAGNGVSEHSRIEPAPEEHGTVSGSRRIVVAAAVITVALGMTVWWIVKPNSVAVIANWQDLERFCTQENLTVIDAPPYAGSGPHHIAVVVTDSGEEKYHPLYGLIETMKARGWSTSFEDIVLVACGRAIRGGF